MQNPNESSIAVYRESFERHGRNPEALGWKSWEEQRLRFSALTSEIPSDTPLSIGDFGCGFGGLLPFLLELGYPIRRYVGVDACPEILKVAAESLSDLCAERGIELSLYDTLPPDVVTDWWVVSGTFNVRGTTTDQEWEAFVLAQLSAMFGSASGGVSANFLSDHVDFQQDGLYYLAPDRLARFVRQHLTRYFIIRHDYMPYEWTFVALRRPASRALPQRAYESV